MSVLHILTVCTHNRTRSVLMAALLREHLARRGVSAEVATAGFLDEGLPPTEMTVRLLAARGIDVSDHRSRRVTRELVDWADLIVTAEQSHVVRIAGDHPGAFERTFTLFELAERADRAGPRGGRGWSEWLQVANQGRPQGSAYLGSPVPSVVDPTGLGSREWSRVVEQLELAMEPVVRGVT